VKFYEVKSLEQIMLANFKNLLLPYSQSITSATTPIATITGPLDSRFTQNYITNGISSFDGLTTEPPNINFPHNYINGLVNTSPFSTMEFQQHQQQQQMLLPGLQSPTSSEEEQ
jgi:hypothetical protein